MRYVRDSFTFTSLHSLHIWLNDRHSAKYGHLLSLCMNEIWRSVYKPMEKAKHSGRNVCNFKSTISLLWKVTLLLFRSYIVRTKDKHVPGWPSYFIERIHIDQIISIYAWNDSVQIKATEETIIPSLSSKKTFM